MTTEKTTDRALLEEKGIDPDGLDLSEWPDDEVGEQAADEDGTDDLDE